MVHNSLGLSGLSEEGSEVPPSFQVVFGFCEGHEREPSVSEVEALICETNLYLEKILKGSTGDSSLQAEAYNIGWTYSPDCPGPVTVTFSVVASYGSGQMVPAHDIYQALKLGDDELKDYLQNYVMNSSPQGSNVFYYTDKMSFEGTLGVQPPEGKISTVSCLEGSMQGPAPPALPEPSRASKLHKEYHFIVSLVSTDIFLFW